MKQFTVSGDDRQVNALGVGSRFTEVIEANSREEAINAIRSLRYAKGREHVHIMDYNVTETMQ